MVRKVVITLLLCMAVPAGSSPNLGGELLLPGTSPLVTYRILFMTGSAFDPPGKEGLAALTASMLAGGGTRAMGYDQIVQALYPMASSINAQVDKEMTVFSGTTHIENLDRYYSLFKDMLLDPGFRPEDFKRLAVRCFSHRVVVNARYASTLKKAQQAEEILREIVEKVAVPM